MLEPTTRRQLVTILSYVLATVIILLPFHAFFTTWAGSNFGHLDAWRIWKEIIIFGAFMTCSYLAFQNTDFRLWIKHNILPKLLVLYLLITIIAGVSALCRGRVNPEALIYGLFSNLRYLGFFVITFLVTLENKILSRLWWKIVLMPAVIVILFGLVQLFIPHDFLRHFGYGPNTIPAYQTIDNKIDYQRIQSTLRGANPLGAYLVVVITTLIGVSIKQKTIKYSLLVLSGVVLWFSYSRSAWIGLFVSLVTFALTVSAKHILKYRKTIGLALAALLLLGVLAFGALKNNDTFENVVFHTSEQSLSPESSNEGRLRALKSGILDLWQEPFGRGTGTAGPASARNNQGARISENYFIQIGQEVGWLGLGVFLAINILLMRELYVRKEDKRALVLLASMIGLTAINLVSHAWADDTLGLLWWGLAGIILATTQAKRQAINK